MNDGDIIWIHEGIYYGHYRSKLESTNADNYITVSTYKKDKVEINGNEDSAIGYVLEVNRNHLI